MLNFFASKDIEPIPFRPLLIIGPRAIELNGVKSKVGL